MKLGISTATFFGKILTEDSFEIMEKIGAGVCEVFLTTFFEYTADFASSLKAKTKNIEVHSIHSLNSQFEPELFNPAKRTRLDAEKVFKDVCLVGKTLDAKYYTFHGPAKIKKTEYIYDCEILGKRAEELCTIAKSYGIELCYENVHWTFYNETGYFKNLKKHAPSLCACLDIKQAMQSKIDYKLFIKEMGDSLRTVHLCDYGADGKLCIPGKGIFDFKELFNILKYNGFTGALLLELYSGDYKGFDEVKKGYEYLRNMLEKK